MVNLKVDAALESLSKWEGVKAYKKEDIPEYLMVRYFYRKKNKLFNVITCASYFRSRITITSWT